MSDKNTEVKKLLSIYGNSSEASLFLLALGTLWFVNSITGSFLSDLPPFLAGSFQLFILFMAYRAIDYGLKDVIISCCISLWDERKRVKEEDDKNKEKIKKEGGSDLRYVINKFFSGKNKSTRETVAASLVRSTLTFIAFKVIVTATASLWASPSQADSITSNRTDDIIKLIDKESDKRTTDKDKALIAANNLLESKEELHKEIDTTGNGLFLSAFNTGDKWQKESYEKEGLRWLICKCNPDNSTKEKRSKFNSDWAYGYRLKSAKSKASAMKKEARSRLNSEITRADRAISGYSDPVQDSLILYYAGLAKKESDNFDKRVEFKTEFIWMLDILFALFGTWAAVQEAKLIWLHGIRRKKNKSLIDLVANLINYISDAIIGWVENFVGIDLNKDGFIGNPSEKNHQKHNGGHKNSGNKQHNNKGENNHQNNEHRKPENHHKKEERREGGSKGSSHQKRPHQHTQERVSKNGESLRPRPNRNTDDTVKEIIGKVSEAIVGIQNKAEEKINSIVVDEPVTVEPKKIVMEGFRKPEKKFVLPNDVEKVNRLKKAARGNYVAWHDQNKPEKTRLKNKSMFTAKANQLKAVGVTELRVSGQAVNL